MKKRGFTLKRLHEPSGLKKGDTIALVAPASCGKEEELKAISQGLLERGFQVKLAANARSTWGYFAGTDHERAQGIMDAFQDESVQAIWCLRGGYGSGRVLDHLDFDIIARHPKIFIGMSDITALHTALNQKAGLVTYLGPNASFLFAASEKDRSFAEKHAWSVCVHPDRSLQFEGSEALVSGKGRGMLTGGNLALLVSQLGTPWQIDTRGKILLLEDVSEYTYRIDRFFCQMKQAGLLEGVQGVILSSWEKCAPKHSHDFAIEDVLKHYFTQAPYPVLLGFPSGHIENQVTLPLGKEVFLDTENRSLVI